MPPTETTPTWALGNHQLLSASQEAHLSFLIQSWLQAIAHFPYLSASSLPGDIPRDIRHIAFQGQEALRCLVRHNVQLVVSRAKRFQGMGRPIGDLIADGFLGLHRAAIGYNATLGYRFSTYACIWIHQFVIRELHRHNRMIRLPEHLSAAAVRAQRFARAFVAANGRLPTVLELSAGTKLRTDQIETILLYAKPVESLDAQTCDGETRLSLIAAAAPNESDLDDLSAISECLTEREWEILKARFGIETGKIVSYKPLAVDLGLSVARIRSLENRALRKCKIAAGTVNCSLQLT